VSFVAHPYPSVQVTAMFNTARFDSPCFCKSFLQITLLQIANGRPTASFLSGSELVKYDLFYVLNVPPHRRLRAFTIVAFDRSQNSPVSSERFLRAAF
jgi:hypothetical protein